MSGKDGDKWLRNNSARVTAEVLKVAFAKIANQSGVKASTTYVAVLDKKTLPPLEVMRAAMSALEATSTDISGGASTITFKLLKAGGIEIVRK